MGTKIEWAEETWNPITGCTPISEGCQNCYAKRTANRLRGRCGYPVDDPFSVTFHQDRLEQPLKWKKPKRIFVCSMGDLFHENITDSQINSVFVKMAMADWHQYILLTKRPERMLEFMDIGFGWRSHMPNVIVGATTENQQRYNERMYYLNQVQAAKKFVSIEPMLGSVSLGLGQEHNNLDLVICGGETGPGARPMFTDWAIDLCGQCEVAGVPFFFKKHGDWWLKKFKPIAKNIENQLLDGKRYQEWPKWNGENS